ncbi:MAG: DUF488 domain-containing protein [Candidatus Micrarchaeota archaeon]|nr:DUF488 domain-containing protein [Candidatus Micrarchaeota archaeon]MDE1824480.1 DUF488 domain-containing protein [Candidatus Micrarchaeota archaeon]MDE1849777.1 DUF488 domain-containing protein [Candidatus Micrarchaeota archaeon]
MARDRATAYTIGHSTRKLSELVRILNRYGIKELIDIRTIPKSRANPQFNEARLGKFLKRHGILYRHMKSLGGLRHPLKDSVNTYWYNASFRGFADYMQTKDFRHAVAELMGIARKKPIVMMCAEAVPWRCHRSLIADALTIRGIKVVHVFSAASSKEHELTKSAVVRKTDITYK